MRPGSVGACKRMTNMNPSVETLEALPKLVAGCMDSCRQCIEVAGMLTPEQYAFGRDEHRSIGEHLRHCIEHFQALLAGLNVSRIDYDKRDRNREIEVCPARFIDTMIEVTDRLRTFDEATLIRSLSMQTLCGAGEERAEISTTVGRELAFLQQHIIHHLAIVKMLAQSMGVMMPADLGVAFSTSIHHAKTAPPARRDNCGAICAH